MHSSKVLVKQGDLEVEIQPYDFGKLLTPEQFALLLTGRCNSFNTEYINGLAVGRLIQDEHRTLQATIFRYLLGVAVGISDGVKPEWTDARNEVAVASGHELGEMIESGKFSIGYMI